EAASRPARRLLLPALLLLAGPAAAADLPKVSKVERQPLAAQVERLVQALEFLGTPLPAADREALQAAAKDKDGAKAVDTIQTILDKHCLAGVRLSAPGKVETLIGPAKSELAEQGWRVFLVKVLNSAGVSDAELRAESPNALPMLQRSTSKPDPKVISSGEVRKRFLDLMMFANQPLVRKLSGLELEYRILQIYSRDAGRKEATLGFGLWRDADKQNPSARSEQVPYLFEAAPAVLVRLRIKDHDGAAQRDGKPVMASFIFRDSQGRVYPAQSRRLAPDFFFHAQVYRADNETVLLQPGKYTVAYTRG